MFKLRWAHFLPVLFIRCQFNLSLGNIILVNWLLINKEPFLRYRIKQVEEVIEGFYIWHCLKWIFCPKYRLQFEVEAYRFGLIFEKDAGRHSELKRLTAKILSTHCHERGIWKIFPITVGYDQAMILLNMSGGSPV